MIRLGSRCRNGYTLIETLVVIGVMATVLIGLGLIMHHLVKLEQQLRSEIPDARSFYRLSDQWRVDAHRAVGFSTTETVDSTLATLTFADGTLAEYRRQPTGIARRLLRGSEQVGQELFRLRGVTEVSWRTEDESRFIVMELSRHRGRILKTADAVQADAIVAAFNMHGQSP